MGNMAAFKDRLKKVRESTGLNRLQFSKFIGIENSSIYYYESGERYPDVFTLKKICEKCNVSADHLLGINEEKAWTIWKKK